MYMHSHTHVRTHTHRDTYTDRGKFRGVARGAVAPLLAISGDAKNECIDIKTQ